MKPRNKYKLLYILAVFIFIVISLGPIIWCLILSITPEADILRQTTDILPSELTSAHYKELLSYGTKANQSITTGLRNSLIMAIISIAITLPISMVSGYVFARYEFKGRKFALYFILITIVIPVFTTIIPIYALFAKLGILDQKPFIGIIYASSFIPMNTWLFLNFYKALPRELWEAAETDGCSHWQVFRHIALPLSRSIILTSILITFLMSWNQYQIPMILISSQENRVITLVLSDFMTRDTISYGLMATSGIIAILPPALVAIFFRKYLISGLTQGAVKG